MQLYPSVEDKEWLGTGIYFWIDDFAAAKLWVISGQRNGWIKQPAVLRMDINTSNCLNVNAQSSHGELVYAYKFIQKLYAAEGATLPKNQRIVNGVPINRFLDCIVVDAVHQIRKVAGKPPYDSVRGMFEDGAPVYPGASIRDKTHAQICVHPKFYKACLSNPTIVWNA